MNTDIKNRKFGINSNRNCVNVREIIKYLAFGKQVLNSSISDLKLI